MLMNKKGQTGGLVTGLVFGVAALVIGVIIAFIIISTLNNASLLTTASAEANSTAFLAGNLTQGVNSVASKIPTVLLIAAIVLILGVLAVLVGVWSKMRMGGGSI
jgi:multisubunit Na+/H+ antiporter MnhC subunit